MEKIIIFIGIFLVFTSCKDKNAETSAQNSGTGKAEVLEVIHTTNYTYLSVNQGDEQKWLAVPKTEVSKGETVYYDGGMLMTKFVSKELNREFEKILFLEGIRRTPEPETVSATDSNAVAMQSGKPQIEKAEVKHVNVSGTVSLAKLFEKRNDYQGKVIKVAGKVVKINPEIMGKNWIHIQDGTDFNGEFDLTVTSQAKVKEGDNVIFEGKIFLNKDFGYGYSYAIIMEEAVLK